MEASTDYDIWKYDYAEGPRYKMDNSGRGPLQVPGFSGIPLKYELPAGQRFAHAMGEWRQNTPVAENELLMVRTMNTITDLTNWHVKVFDDASVECWRTSIADPALSDRAWKWYVRELRDKAKVFKRTGFIRVLDTGSVVCKCDNVLSASLVSGLASSIRPLFTKSRQPNACREHLGLDVVDPQMFPLVFGRTHVLEDGGATSLRDLFGAAHPRRTAIAINEGPQMKSNRDEALQNIRNGD